MSDFGSSAGGSLKKIAGDMLLLLYTLQRKKGSIEDGVLSFSRNMTQADEIVNSELGRMLLETAQQSLPDTFNALKYLEEKHFISFKNLSDSASHNFANLRVMAAGIDIIEGIVRGEAERNAFYLTFNIKLADNVSIENLVKNEIKFSVI